MTVQLVQQEEVYDLALQLSLRIIETDFQPDVIVGIARGGLVPARYLCDFLDIDMLTSIKIKHYDAGSKKRQDVSLDYPLSVDVEGKRVLLVDDVNDTGETLKAAHEHILSGNPAGLQTAVLHEKDDTVFSADFHQQKIGEWRWLTYPWARVEDLSEFAGDLVPHVNNVAQLQKLLNRHHDMNVTEEDLQTLVQLGKLTLE